MRKKGRVSRANIKIKKERKSQKCIDLIIDIGKAELHLDDQLSRIFYGLSILRMHSRFCFCGKDVRNGLVSLLIWDYVIFSTFYNCEAEGWVTEPMCALGFAWMVCTLNSQNRTPVYFLSNSSEKSYLFLKYGQKELCERGFTGGTCDGLQAPA